MLLRSAVEEVVDGDLRCFASGHSRLTHVIGQTIFNPLTTFNIIICKIDTFESLPISSASCLEHGSDFGNFYALRYGGVSRIDSGVEFEQRVIFIKLILLRKTLQLHFFLFLRLFHIFSLLLQPFFIKHLSFLQSIMLHFTFLVQKVLFYLFHDHFNQGVWGQWVVFVFADVDETVFGFRSIDLVPIYMVMIIAVVVILHKFIPLLFFVFLDQISDLHDFGSNCSFKIWRHVKN